MSASVKDAEAVKEARRLAGLGLAVIDTIELGPLDYNVTSAADYLRAAAGTLEDFAREHSRAAKAAGLTA